MTLPAAGLDPGRVAEIVVTRAGAPNRRGSGYLVTAGRVLTAAHVVADGVAIEVRLDADCPTERRLQASLHWAHSGADIAVLSVGTEDQDVVAAAEFGRVTERDVQVTCSVMGFPLFKVRDARDGTKYRETYHSANGTCDVLSNRREGTLDLRVPPPAPRDPTRSPWEGMSGAAVWCGERIIGVVGLHHFFDGRDHLAVRRADHWHARLGPGELLLLEEAVGALLVPERLVDVVPPAPLHDWPPVRGVDQRLLRYLGDAAGLAVSHPYSLHSLVAPPLSSVYFTQLASRRDAGHRHGEPSADEGAADMVPVAAEHLVGRHRGVQVVGGPGAGKSSLLRSIARITARQWLDGGGQDFLPVLVRAEDLLADSGGITDRLTRAVQRETGGTSLSTRELNTLLNREPPRGAHWLALVDGLDEVPSWRRPDVLHIIGALRARPGWRVMVTSRPLARGGVDRISDAEHPTYAIEPFLADQLPDFAQKWFQKVGASDPEEMTRSFTRELDRDRRLRELARIPLIATMMCVVFVEDPTRGLPLNRSELYERFIRILIGHRDSAEGWQRHRTLIDPHDTEAQQAVTALLKDLRLLLEKLAHSRLVTIDSNRDAVHDTLLARAVVLCEVTRPASVPERKWQQILHSVLEHSGLLVQRQGDMHFLYPSIEEYLAAWYLFRHRGLRRELAPRRLKKEEDLEIKIFLAGIQAMTDPAGLERPLARLLRWPRRGHHRFVVELLNIGIPIPERIRKRTVAILRAAVVRFDRSQLPREWKLACQQLADLDERQLFAGLEALSNDRGKVGNARVEAAKMALERDRDLGMRLLDVILADQALDGNLRFHVAETLCRQNPARTVTVFENLAADEGMGDLRIRAAVEVDQVSPARGKVCFARLTTVRSPYDDSLDLVRAARMFARRHPIEGTARLEDLSRDAAFEGASRVAAVWELLEMDMQRGTDAAIALARDRRLRGKQEMSRIEAACMLPLHRRDEAARLLVEICADEGMTDKARITAGVKAGERDRFLGGKALVELSTSWGLAKAALKIQSAEAALPFEELLAAEALEQIARSRAQDSMRLRAAHAIPDHQGSGVGGLWRALSNDPSLTGANRLTAAREADRRGPARRAACLMALALQKHFKPALRLAAAKAAAERNDPDATGALRTLALDGSLSDTVRLEAALAVPESDQAAQEDLLDQLTRTAADAKTKIEAGRRLGLLNPKRGAERLTELATDTGVRGSTPGTAPSLQLRAALALATFDPAAAIDALRVLTERTDVPASVRDRAAKEADRLHRTLRR